MLASRLDGLSNRSSTTYDTQNLISEINHSLSTPLAQIELTLKGVQEALEDNGRRRDVDAALQSVELSRAVLAAYRDVSAVAREADNWDIKDLNMSLNGAAKVFLSRTNGTDRGIDAVVTAATALNAKYTNYFLLAVTLPLMQNAVEGAVSGSRIECDIEDANDVVIRIVNQVDAEPDMRSVGQPDYSTKGAGHSGLGLPSVKTLISRVEGAGLRVSCRDKTFRAEVRLPVPR
jgi:hypothetical protein